MTLTKDQFESRASAITLPGRAFIDGAYCDASDGDTFDTINPATGERLGVVAHCTAADVDRAVAAARRSFDDGSWSRTAPKHREEVLFKLAEFVHENATDLAVMESLDAGKTIWISRSAAR